MIFALRRPGILLGLVLGFLVGIMLRAAVQRTLARRGGLRRHRGARLHPVGREQGAGPRPGGFRPRAGWSAYLDPYGTVAAVLSGAGWGVRPEVRRGDGDVLALLAALVVHGVLAMAGFAGFVAAGGSWADLGFIDPTSVLHGALPIDDLAFSVTLGFGMVNLACGLLALVPIPPLELGVVVWSRVRSGGARRLAYRLLEEQWGVAAVLLLLLLPLAGQQPVLLALIDTVGNAILGAL